MLLVVSAALAQDALRFAVVGDTQTDGSETSINSTVFPEPSSASGSTGKATTST